MSTTRKTDVTVPVMRRAALAMGWMAISVAAAVPGHAQTFTKITDPANPIVSEALPAGNTYYGTSWIDYDGDGDLDLFANQDYLYENDGTGSFTPVIGSGLWDAQPGAGGGFAGGGNTWADYDNDGLLDAYLSGNLSHLYRNEGDGTFARVTSSDIGDGTAARGWSCAWGDHDNDGFVDLVVTHLAGFVAGAPTTNHLFDNDGSPGFGLTRVTTGPIVMGLVASVTLTRSRYRAMRSA